MNQKGSCEMKVVFEVELFSRRGADNFVFSFEMETHRMARKYLELVRAFKLRSKKIDQANSYWNFHLAEDSLVSLTNDLQTRIDSLRSEPDIPMPYIVSPAITQEELNSIHCDFEKFLTLINQTKLAPRNLQQAVDDLLQINLLIHKIENHHRLRKAVEAGHRESISCNFGFRFEGDEFFNLEADDYDCFTSDSVFGDIFCGYNTTGKSFVHCFYDGDIELVRSGGVRPQRTFSTEGFIHFGPNGNGSELMAKMEEWWRDHRIDESGYKFDDRKNAFGLIRIGRIIEPREFQGKTHWEKLVFLSQFDGVADCRIVDRPS